ncbi:four helix bundle protein, partial [Patescibacteria group bacterium]|nr:four helix bundle protein [Patescibacteria group bacterium]
MDNFDIPIFKKSYELYKQLHEFRIKVSKQDRHTLWQRLENSTLKVIEGIIRASSIPKDTKLPILEEASHNLNITRIFIRLAKDTKIIDFKKYDNLQNEVDEIGRML